MPVPANIAPISTDSVLEQFSTALMASDSIAVDTEFNRTSTYRPELCLVQLADESNLALVDMLAGLDPAPLTGLLCDSPGTKIFHAAKQDMEALQLNLGRLPNCLFDTQVGAALLGFPAQIGYASLVTEFLGVELDKGATRTDWSRRPLSTKQLHYAAADVTYLLPLYFAVRERLEANGRWSWACEDSALMLDPALYAVAPEQAWQRVGSIAYLAVPIQARARALAGWRETRAAESNRPRQWILSDQALLNIAHANPTDAGALGEIGEVPAGLVRRQADGILELLRAADAAVENGQTDCRQQPRIQPAEQAAVKKLAKTVAARAGELGIPSEVLATRKELSGMVRGETSQRVTSGWRRDVIGSELLDAL